jgi:hypothetical protein
VSDQGLTAEEADRFAPALEWMWGQRGSQPTLHIDESFATSEHAHLELEEARDALVLVEAAYEAAMEAQRDRAEAAVAKAKSLRVQLGNVLTSKDTRQRLERITLYIRRRTD